MEELFDVKPRREIITIGVYDCPRCGNNHTDNCLEFKRFTKIESVRDYTHWSICPDTNEPILLRLIGE